jgi:hypothetical protein
VLDRPGRRPADRGAHLRGPAFGQHHAGGRGGLRGSAHRAQVLGVLYLVEGDDQRIGRGQEPLGVGVGVGLGLGADALMVRGAADALELRRVGRLDRLGPQPGLATGAVGRPDAGRSATAAQQLAHRPAPVDDHPRRDVTPA